MYLKTDGAVGDVIRFRLFQTTALPSLLLIHSAYFTNYTRMRGGQSNEKKIPKIINLLKS